jgi:hypothetical protein
VSSRFHILEMLKSIENAGINIIALAGGFFGGLASLIFNDERYSVKRAIAIVLMSSISAGFLTSLAASYFGLSMGFSGAVGYLIGLMVHRVTDKLLDFIKALDAKTIFEIVKRRFKIK